MPKNDAENHHFKFTQWRVCLKEDTELYQHAVFFLATNACNYLLYEACNKNKNQQTKHFRQLNQTIWLVCYHMIIGDRSIDNILRGFLSFTNLSNSEYRHKSKMIMLLRDEKSGIKSGNIMKNGKSYLVKEYFKYLFLRIRTITEFHI